MFGGISPNEYFTTFPGMFSDISLNVLRHSTECLGTFPGMFEATFPEMFEGIPRNVWSHSPEYNIPPISRVSRIPFPVPVFLFLYIAKIKQQNNKNSTKKLLIKSVSIDIIFCLASTCH